MYQAIGVTSIVAAVLWFGAAAVAQFSTEWRECLGLEGPNPDVIIDGCTTIILANQEAPSRLATAHNNRGVALKAKGEFDRALQDYGQSIQLNPSVANYYNNRGIIYRIEGDYEDAIKDYDTAIQLKKDYIAAYYNRALARSDIGQAEMALSDFNTVLHFNPNNEYALYGRGLLKQKTGDAQGGADDLAAARRSTPTSAGS